MFDSILTPGAPWSWTDFFITLFFLSLIIFVRYIAMSWALFWALWTRKSTWAEARRLQKTALKPDVVKTEIKYSLYSTIVFALPAAIMLEGLKRGWTQIYTSQNPIWNWLKPYIFSVSPSQGAYKIYVGSESVGGGVTSSETVATGIIKSGPVQALASSDWQILAPIGFEIFYVLLSVGLYLFLHDTFYYWFHRWMHKPGIYQVWHQAHHYSTNPTPWASFAFHPYEALVAGLVIPAMAFVIPIHLGAMLFLLTFMTVTAVINHCGFELFPKSWVQSRWFGGWFIGATHHNHHHTKFTKNYGLYFRFWDKWMKTDVM
jgi:sterol desaturase/sphingolipid hydroxylase (fatty acid hydroxylase superfamily)